MQDTQDSTRRTHLDIWVVHTHRSFDGRHWSSSELAEFTDGRITHEEMMKRVRERDPDAVRLRKPERNYTRT